MLEPIIFLNQFQIKLKQSLCSLHHFNISLTAYFSAETEYYWM